MNGAGAEAPAPASFAFFAGTPTRLTVALRLDAPPEAVAAFHRDVRNLPRISPGPTRIIAATVPSRAGDLQVIELGIWPLRTRVHARVIEAGPRRIVDVLERGPFAHFRQSRRIIPAGAGTVLVDTVEFRFRGGGRLGKLFDLIAVRPILRLMFAVRHRRTRRLLEGGRRRARRT